jgi:uncharacterized RmlC-like cupin family protein
MNAVSNTVTKPAVVRTADLAAYAPANHTGTSNVRVIGPETVGATAIEVLVGTIVKSHGAKPHAHPYLEQCAYMLEGTGETGSHGSVEAIPPGCWGYVPEGVFHSFRVTSEQPGRVLVVYTPPYGENPAQTITEPAASAVDANTAARVLAVPDVAGTATVPLITPKTVGARWVEVDVVRIDAGGELHCAARPDAEQVLYVEHGSIAASAGGEDFELAPGDFLFLPRGAPAALRSPSGRRGSGFLIKGRLPSATSHIERNQT